jgi:hypothetical protein
MDRFLARVRTRMGMSDRDQSAMPRQPRFELAGDRRPNGAVCSRLLVRSAASLIHWGEGEGGWGR